MTYDLTDFDARAEEAVEWLRKEFSTIRTGRATTALLDGVRVDSYGAKVPINQVGTIGIEDPRTIRVSIWDSDQVHAVECAILDANLGLSVVVDDTGLRVVFPELTGERREQLLKFAKGKLEDARVSVRQARDEEVKRIDAAKLSDDDSFNAKEALQKHVDETNKELGDLFETKEKEISV